FNLLRFDGALALPQKTQKWFCFNVKARARGLQDLALFGWRRRSAQQERVAEQHAESREPIEQQPAQGVLIRKHAPALLPQPQQLRTELAFHLRAIERAVDLQRFHQIRPIENPVALADVLKLDRKAVA